MKTLNLSISGSSDLIYLYFFDDDLNDLLRKSAGDFPNDFPAFMEEFASLNKWICRGFDYERVICEAKSDSILIYEGSLIPFAFEPRVTPDEIEEEFQSTFPKRGQFCDALTFNHLSNLERINGANTLLQNTDHYRHCVVERVKCERATGSLNLEVPDDFKLSEIRPMVVDFDTGDWQGLMRFIYAATDIEGEIVGFRYKGELIEFDTTENIAGFNSYQYLINDHNMWSYDDSVKETAIELGF